MDTYSFTPYEIFEVIAKTEDTVSRFYAHLAGLDLGEEASKVLRVLSEEESEHGKMFLKMGQLQKNSGAKQTFMMNVREILENSIQRIDRSLLSLTPWDRKAVDFRQCIEMAIMHEKESIRVYEKMKESLPQDFAEVFEKTIAVERGHQKSLEGVLKNCVSGRS